MMFQTYLDQKAKHIDAALEIVLKTWRNQYGTNHHILPLLDAFITSCEGGKRLRGAFVILGYELNGGDSRERILAPAAAFEIFQTAILSHDDIIDKSLTRRGKPTLYKKIGHGEYGTAQAMTLGDMGYFLALQVMADSVFDDSQKNRALSAFAKIVQDTAVGQMLDIHLPTKKAYTQDDVIAVAYNKTATYTFIGPFLVGSLLCGKENKPLLTFGEKLGIAYQLQDDILGIFGDKKVLGKSNVTDIQEKKATFLSWYARNKANAKQKKILDQLYGNVNISEKEAIEIREIFRSTGAYKYAVSISEKYMHEAVALIPLITKDLEKQELLVSLVSYLLERGK